MSKLYSEKAQCVYMWKGEGWSGHGIISQQVVSITTRFRGERCTWNVMTFGSIVQTKKKIIIIIGKENHWTQSEWKVWQCNISIGRPRIHEVSGSVFINMAQSTSKWHSSGCMPCLSGMLVIWWWKTHFTTLARGSVLYSTLLSTSGYSVPSLTSRGCIKESFQEFLETPPSGRHKYLLQDCCKN